jgi:DNA-binding beta-propeller fold protein YncE
MKKQIFSSLLFALMILVFIGGRAQTLKPKIQFQDEPRTHNVHVASDGQFLYTINGGKAYMGQISKFTLDGSYVTSYDINLDMRSIMYNAKEKIFYVCTYDRNIYKITDIEKGSYELTLSELYDNEQANLALSPSGKLLYYFNDGTLKIYKFPSGKLSKTIKGLDKGSEVATGNAAVAVDDKHIYTWNTDYKLIFVYDLKGTKIKSVQISNGDYGFSLSCANGLIFVSTDGNYDIGTWYGYDVLGN